MSNNWITITKTGRLTNQIRRKVSRMVRNLQMRITKAVDAGDQRRANSLRRLLMGSTSLKLLAIDRVKNNKGGKTPGIDGFTIKDATTFWETFKNVNWDTDPKPLRRVYVPKKKWMREKTRPLGIPTVYDRILQAMCLMVIEPTVETMFHDRSYGFRPKRSTQDTMLDIFFNCNSRTHGHWILDADIERCFDRINHKALLEKCKGYIRNNKIMKVIKKHLEAGIIYMDTYEPTTQGTPQGGIFSPCLANIALDGMESCTKKAKVIRYADDLIAIGRSKEDIEEARNDIERFLNPMGLNLSVQKTRIIQRDEGFDFLGFNFKMRKPNWKKIRDSICSDLKKYPTRERRRGAYTERKESLIIKPADDNIKRLKDNIRRTVHGRGRKLTQRDLIKTLEPIINGWANYYSMVCSKETYNDLDSWLWRCLWSWGCRRHPNKGKKWIKNKYFQKLRNRNWQFMTKDETDPRRKWYILPHFKDTKIIRHIKIRFGVNPYRVQDAEYFRKRDRDFAIRMFGIKNIRIWGTNCYFCGQPMDWEKVYAKEIDLVIHHLIPLAENGSSDPVNCRIAHESCHIGAAQIA